VGAATEFDDLLSGLSGLIELPVAGGAFLGEFSIRWPKNGFVILLAAQKNV